MLVTDARTSFACIFSRYERPGINSCDPIHSSLASNWSATVGGAALAAITSPRLTSTSSARVTVTESPGAALARSPSHATIRVTCVSTPEGSTRTWSPRCITPADTRPANPRKSGPGRLIHCTGIRNGPDAGGPPASTVSRYPITVGPSYQGMRGLGDTRWSPSSAEIGIAVTSTMPHEAANGA